MNQPWQRIWTLQGQLNKISGIDTIDMGVQHSDYYTVKHTWIHRYMDACVNEAVECKENFYYKWWCKEVIDGDAAMYEPRDVAKIRLELIDCLHFCISALHLARPRGEGIQFDVIPMYLPETWEDMYRGLNKLIQFCLMSLTDHVFYELRALMAYMRLDDAEILRIYEMKWKANMARQARGYAVDSKTEDDNLAIEAKI